MPVLRNPIEISDAVKALKFTKDRREVFLRALAETGIVTIAAGAAGITRARAYQVRQQDQGFATAWDEAEQRAADALEAEAWRRAVSGVPAGHAGHTTRAMESARAKALVCVMQPSDRRMPGRFSRPRAIASHRRQRWRARWLAATGPRGAAAKCAEWHAARRNLQ